MDNITVGESALRDIIYNEAIDKSTPLPPVEECVMIDVEKLGDLLLSPKLMGLYPRELAEKLANSNSILKWRKEKP